MGERSRLYPRFGGSVVAVGQTLTTLTVLPRSVWEAVRAAYVDRVRPWVDDRLLRMSRHQKHPVYDFLFEYYSFRPAHLLRWTPGSGILLEGAAQDDVAWSEFVALEGGLVLSSSAFPEHRRPYLRWAINYLDATLHREPSFGCLGMHEWAMVYRDPEVRHPQVPLRLSRTETDRFVESQSIRCTHYDAFRFFTPQARPRNRWELTRVETTERDQPGCLHVQMDLYRYAYKIAPFCPSDLVAGCFELARAAREADMRASPYDLTAFGFSPIAIETPEGRTEYTDFQHALHERGQPLRERLLETYRRLVADSL